MPRRAMVRQTASASSARRWSRSTCRDNTPFPHWKRQTHRGGISDPLIVSWPKGIGAQGEVRRQYTHAIDVMPTLLDVLGYDNPQFLRGVPQEQLSGASFKGSFADGAAAEHRPMQYYEMYGNRGMYKDGWMIASFHPTPGIPVGWRRRPGHLALRRALGAL